MSGQDESWIDNFVAKVKNKNVDEILGYKPEIETILNYTPVSLRGLAPLQCAEDAFLLTQFAYHVQKSVNYFVSRKNWAESFIRVKANTSNYNSWSYEERKMGAVKDDAFLRKVYDVMLHCQRIADELYLLSNRIDAMSQMLKNLQYSKEKNNA